MSNGLPATGSQDLEPLVCQREEFRLPPGVRYLNCAYMSPLSRLVEEAGVSGLRRKRVPSTIVAADFFEESDELRRLFGQLVHCDPTRIALIPSVSYGITTAARNVQTERGQNVVVSGEQFPSHLYPWSRLAAERDLEIRSALAPDAAAGRGSEWTARILEAIDPATAVVALPQVHWTDGTRFDLAAIGCAARQVGAALIIDGTQSVGAVPFDVGETQPDALVCAGYKWLLGPFSLGLAYYGPRFDGGQPLEETWLARVGSDDFRRVAEYRDAYRPGAVRYDVGERPNFVLVPMLVAALTQLLSWGVPRIQAYCRELCEDFLGELTDLGAWVEEEEWREPHLFGLHLPDAGVASRLEPALRERQIFVSLRGSAVRVSPHVYNGADDLAALWEGLQSVLR